MTASLSLLYTTFESKEDAIRISHKLLENKLVACVNILPEMQSLYMWEGKRAESKEIAVLLKTTSEKIPALMSGLQELHPYKTPALIEISLNRTNAAFAKWVEESVR